MVEEGRQWSFAELKAWLEEESADKSKPKQAEFRKKDAPPPRWPEWLPQDWFTCQRLSGGKFRAYYYCPSRDKGFFNKAQVEQYMEKNGLEQPSAPKGQVAPALPKGPRTRQSKGGSDAPPGGLGPAESPLAKRSRPAESTDDEVARISEGEPGEGWAQRSCRGGAAWLILPDDVLSLNLEALSVQAEIEGWRCHARSEHRYTFSGSPDLVMYESGKLLVRSSEGAVARRIAKMYVDSWLILE